MTDDLDAIIAGACDLDGVDLDKIDLDGVPPRRAEAAPAKDKPPRPGEAAGIGFRQRVTTTVERRRFYDLRNVENAIALIQPLPKRRETVHAIMGGDFAAWDLVPAILGIAGKPARALYVATLGFNEKNNTHLCQLMAAGDIQAATVLCSDYFAKADAKTYADAKARLAKVGGVLNSTRNHAKILALDLGADAFVVEASANLRSCNNLEQIAISNDRALFDFHRTWISSVTSAQ
jgi:hypothetical protein